MPQHHRPHLAEDSTNEPITQSGCGPSFPIFDHTVHTDHPRVCSHRSVLLRYRAKRKAHPNRREVVLACCIGQFTCIKFRDHRFTVNHLCASVSMYVNSNCEVSQKLPVKWRNPGPKKKRNSGYNSFSVVFFKGFSVVVSTTIFGQV